MSWILRGVEAVDSPLAGGKARALASMERGGLPVPPWFVVSASAFEESLSGDHRIALETARDDSSSQLLLRDLSVHPAIRAEIDAAVRELCPGGERVAVRSSASDEDGAQQSFAGQLESFLNVPAGGRRQSRGRRVALGLYPPAVCVSAEARAAAVRFGLRLS